MKVMETVKASYQIVQCVNDTITCTNAYLLLGKIVGGYTRKKVKDAIEPHTYRKVKENVA